MLTNLRITTFCVLICIITAMVSSCVGFDTLREAGAARVGLEEGLVPEPISKHPARCLSLSGGGMRAASYGIGVMRALSEFDQLDSLDVISGVSGGSYAMLWYYAGMYGKDGEFTPGAIVGSAPLFFDANLHEWEKNHSLWKYAIRALYERPLAVASALAYKAWISITLPADYFLNLRLKDPLLFQDQEILGDLYAGRIQEFYVDYRKPSVSIPSLTQLETFVEKYKLPWPVLNTTIYDSMSAIKFDRKRIFEVTPIMVGSEAAGYASVPKRVNTLGEKVFDKKLGNYVRASGAALDVPLERTQYSFLRAFFGLGLGMKIYSPRAVDGETVGIFYLADGGFSENLGAYALVRRGCKEIIIVDAEHDPWFQFEGYYVLGKHIREDFGKKLTVGKIEDQFQKITDNPGSYASTGQNESREPRISSWPSPLMEGVIAPDGQLEKVHEQIQVRYLKLSVDRDRLPTKVVALSKKQCAPGNVGASPEAYFTNRLVDYIGDNPKFPQNTTWNQWLLDDRVGALVDLGYAHMKAMLCKNL